MHDLHPQLLERVDDLAEIDRCLVRLDRRQGSLVWFEGSPGIGKSALLAAAAKQAGERNVTVSSATGHVLEQGYPFGVVVQLFEPLLRRVTLARRTEILSGAAALTAPLLDPRPHIAQDGRRDIFAVVHGLYWVAANIAEHNPLLLVVDDAQWADRPSLRFLDYLAGRLADLPVALVGASRTNALGAPELAAVLGHRRATVRRPQPLSEEAVSRLLGGGHDEHDRRTFHRLTGGNPLLVSELVENLAIIRSAERDAAAAGGEALPTVVRRVGRLDEPAQQLARACAVAGDGCPLSIVLRAAGLQGRSSTAIESLIDAAILAEADPIQFVHPLVQSSVAAIVDRADRVRLHGRIATILDEHGAPPEVIAAHLLAAEPAGSRRTVEILRQAARTALHTGTPSDAVAWLLRAVAEGAADTARTELLLELAQAEAAAHDPAWRTRLDDALGGVDEPEPAARRLLRLGSVLQNLGELSGAAEFAWRGMQLVRDEGSDLSDRLLAVYATSASIDLDERDRGLARINGALRGRELPSSSAGRLLRAHMAYERAIAGGRPEAFRVDEISGLAREAVDPDGLGHGARPDVPYQALLTLYWCDELSIGEAIVASLLERARRKNDVVATARASNHRARFNLARCRPADAAADAEVACEGSKLGWRVSLPASAGLLALARIELDDLVAAQAALDLLAPDSGAWTSGASYNTWLFARGSVLLAQDHAGDALDALLECGRRQDRMGSVNPMALPWRSTAALAHARSGDHGLADELVREEYALADRFGAPRAIAAAMRVAAVIGPRAKQVDRLQRAVAVSEQAQSTIELARCQLELGRALRRRGERAEARDHFRRVLAIAERGGASLLARRAAEELTSAGARPRRMATTGVAALTPSERRVAALAAGGRRNREIAEELLVSVKTVEFHIGNAFCKLSIASRDELADVMSAELTSAVGPR